MLTDEQKAKNKAAFVVIAKLMASKYPSAQADLEKIKSGDASEYVILLILWQFKFRNKST